MVSLMAREIKEFLLKLSASKMIKQIKENVFQLRFKQFGSCVYLLKLKNKNIVIDTSSRENREELLADLQQLKIKPEKVNIILLTHNHYDHNGNLELFANAEVYNFKNIEKLKVNGVKVIYTPGHTYDSICFLYKDILFSGDTLFHGGIGRTDLQESQPEKMSESLEKLKKIKYKILCSGHVD